MRGLAAIPASGGDEPGTLELTQPTSGGQEPLGKNPGARTWRPSPHTRTRAGILRLFDGLELLEPGLVQIQQWRPGTAASGQTRNQLATAVWPVNP